MKQDSQDEIVIRDMRIPGWLWMHKTALQRAAEAPDETGRPRGHYGVAVYAVLCSYANQKTQVAWPSCPTIAKLLNMGWQEVSYILRDLEKASLIQIRPRVGKSSMIYLLGMPDSEADEQTPLSDKGVCAKPKVGLSPLYPIKDTPLSDKDEQEERTRIQSLSLVAPLASARVTPKKPDPPTTAAQARVAEQTEALKPYLEAYWRATGGEGPENLIPSAKRKITPTLLEARQAGITAEDVAGVYKWWTGQSRWRSWNVKTDLEQALEQHNSWQQKGKPEKWEAGNGNGNQAGRSPTAAGYSSRKRGVRRYGDGE